MDTPLLVNQALFGYSDGHGLISSSVPLPASALRLLNAYTDLSGPTTSPGFECSCTGFPLSDTPWYAIFYTWPAPEMSRPGCVWSHVLLIELADLARVTDLSIFLPIFSRPRSAADTRYKKPLSMPLISPPKRLLAGSLKPIASDLLNFLYSQDKLSVCQVSPDSQLLEDLLFEIWSQQWPRLRRKFSFSSGSLSDRNEQGIKFDLQVIPKNVRNELAHNTARNPKINSLILLDERPPSAKSPPDEEWLNLAVSDLFDSTSNEFRSFLRTFGADVENPRLAFRPLAISFCTRSAVQADIKAIAALFPNAKEAVTLKRAVVANAINTNVWNLLTFLTDRPEAQAFDSLTIDLSKHSERLWQENSSNLIHLLSNHLNNKWTATIVEQLAKILQPFEIADLLRNNPDFAHRLILFNPELMFQPSAWRIPNAAQYKAVAFLDECSLTQEGWSQVLLAALRAGSSAISHDLVERTTPVSIEAALPWLESPEANISLPAPTWKAALSVSAGDHLRDLLSPDQLAFCTWLAPRERVRNLPSERADVVTLINSPQQVVPASLQPFVSFLKVSIGLRSSGEIGVRALGSGFFVVHKRLSSGMQTDDEWQLLQADLPSVVWWKEWDRCKRLRKAVVQWLGNRSSLINVFQSYAKSDYDKKLARTILRASSRKW